jgi:hypothetical protein
LPFSTCRWARDGRFIVKQNPQSKRLTRMLTALRQAAWGHMRAPMAEQQRWYVSILRGHYVYYGLPNNSLALSAFHQEVRRIWFRCLRQRSQTARRLNWDRFQAMLVVHGVEEAGDVGIQNPVHRCALDRHRQSIQRIVLAGNRS